MSVIAIFDSGVGGLSIHQEIKQRLPDNQYVFVSDNQAFPYGTKPEAELKQRVQQVVARIIEQFDPDLLVIACNTASTVVLPLLRDKFDLPIVGVVPAIKPAAQLTKSNVIGLLATPATIQRDYTNQLISDFAPNCDVIKIGSSLLVQIAEDKLYGKQVDLEQVKAEIQPVLDSSEIDVLVLACTHFPLLIKDIEVIINVKSDIKLVDSGKGIANRVAQLLTELSASQSNREASIAVFTENENLTTKFQSQLANMGFEEIGLLKN